MSEYDDYDEELDDSDESFAGRTYWATPRRRREMPGENS